MAEQARSNTLASMSAARPQLPPIRETKNVFHVYKDVLMLEPRSKLPLQIEVTDPDHVRIFNAILLNHPRWKAKIGCGIKNFFVRRSALLDGHHANDEVCCIYVRRMDNTVDDFSLFKCYGKQSWKDDGKFKFDGATNQLKRKV